MIALPVIFLLTHLLLDRFAPQARNDGPIMKAPQ